jgi:hypothetical protein
MTMAESNIDKALGIVANETEDDDSIMGDANAPGCLSRDISAILPPLFERQRSDSPRSVSKISSLSCLGKEYHVVADVNGDDNGITAEAVPLPLTTSASTELRHLIQDYFGPNSCILNNLLPKTKLTFYADSEEFNKSGRVDPDYDGMDTGIKEMESEMKDAEAKIDAFELRQLLPDFTEDAEKLHLKFLVSPEDYVSGDIISSKMSTQNSLDSDSRITHAPTITESHQPSVGPKNNSERPAPRNKKVLKPSRKKTITKSKKRASKAKLSTNKIMNKKQTTVGSKIIAKNMFTAKKPTEKIMGSQENRKRELKKVIEKKTSKKAKVIHAEYPESTNVDKSIWDQNYMKLMAFYIKNGHSNVLRSDPDRQLSGWVKRQRNNLKENRLSNYHIRCLNEIDFVWNRLESAWYDKYNMLKEYAAVYGKADVPSSYNRSLAEWTQRQRREYRSSRKIMTTTRIVKLEAIPNWSWGRPGKTRKPKTDSESEDNKSEDDDSIVV